MIASRCCIHLLTESYDQVRRYAPALLETFDFRAAPAVAPLMAAIDTLRVMNRSNARKVPDDAPTSFVRKRWQPYVLTETGAGSLNRRRAPLQADSAPISGQGARLEPRRRQNAA
jgi:hypothetical protein